MINIWIILGIIYLLGMVFIGSRYCCFCGDHSGNDLFCLFLWFIAAPYYSLKYWREGIDVEE